MSFSNLYNAAGVQRSQILVTPTLVVLVLDVQSTLLETPCANVKLVSFPR